MSKLRGKRVSVRIWDKADVLGEKREDIGVRASRSGSEEVSKHRGRPTDLAHNYEVVLSRNSSLWKLTNEGF